MSLRSHGERRKARHRVLTLEPSFLFRVRPGLAWMIAVGLLCAVATAEFLSATQVWFGPAYLAVIALVAWSISSRIAIATGLLILSFRLVFGDLSIHPYGSEFVISNLFVRIVGLSIVVGFIGLARRSCEREWRNARTDPLTGAWNRQAFFEIVERDQFAGGWSAIVYADLDGLKRVNDEEGHARGDESLRRFAEIVRKSIRKGDVFARMGGDEFVILMKVRDQDSGLAVARRLHEAVNVDGRQDGAALGCSFGILLLPGGSRSIDAELSAADELMYKAKLSGAGAFLGTAIDVDGRIHMASSFPAVDAPDREKALPVPANSATLREGHARSATRAAA
jgi:diguanylate cyclase (GGDEF)-like protein